jgi:Transposase, Mutator family
MKTPKRLYPSARIIYHPELSACPVCGGPLMLANYLLGDKTVQTLTAVVSVASRPARCADPQCAGASMCLRSAAGQQVALPAVTYGYDVVVRIGWWRQTRCATYGEIHTDLTPQIQIAESQVRHLYQHVYLPLLACHERQQTARLTQAAAQHGGLVIALDGLAPEGGEPQLWCMRELLTGVVLRSGWLSRQDQAAFEGFVQPLRDLAWPIRALVSDKQRGLLPAIATVLPTTPHQFCQSHYLRNLAEPLAAADSTLTVRLRHAVRQALGPQLLADQPPDPAQPNVLTMTGLLVAPPLVPDEARAVTAEPSTGATAALPAPAVAADPACVPRDAAAGIAADVVTQLLRRTRYLLTLTGRPPLRLAGIETYAGLAEVVVRSRRLLEHRADPQLASLVCGLEDALGPLAPTVAELQIGAGWLARIAAVLAPAPATAPTAAQVAHQLQDCLDQLARDVPAPDLVAFQRHLQKVSRSYWPGLFHCYDHADIPRTNNGMESLFRDTQRRVLRTTGQKGRTRRILHRSGAWELLAHPPTEAASLDALRQIAPTDLTDERQRMRQHAERFRLHTRSMRQTTAQLDRLEQQWLALPPTATG